MEPEAFIAEVYGRISRRRPPSARVRSWAEMANDPMVVQSAFEMAPLLPEDKDAAILDVGFGRGWFVAACVSLGYRNITAAEFGVENYAHMREWSPGIKLQNVDTYIAGFLAERPGVFEFIHLSHLIEHIPKYTLLHFVDSLFVALKSGKGDAGGGGHPVHQNPEYGRTLRDFQLFCDAWSRVRVRGQQSGFAVGYLQFR